MSDDNSFFVELQMEFLNESAFLLESYEESMMSLENGTNPAEDLSQIFRVAHSVKGGAAAVGLPDLCKFAHIMEDLLSGLRANPELVNSDVISLLLRSGDELKKRISSLQKGENHPWNPSALEQELIQAHEDLTGSKSHSHSEVAAPVIETKAEAPDDFFPSPAPVIVSETPPEEFANLELMAELMAQMSPEDRAAFEQKETQPAEKPVSPTPASSPVKEPPSNSGAVSKAAQKSQNVVIKVDTGRVDSVLDAVGELVVLKNQLVDDDYIKGGGNLRLEGIVDQLDKAVRELYEKTLSIRMTPLKSLFVKIQRIVRDVSLSLNKPVDLQLIGEETEVERTVFELLGDPLVHLVRNAMDHGVENSQVRAERNKPATAKVMVSAKQSGGNVIIDIVDDGGGINRQKVLKKAVERNLIAPGVDPDSLSDDQVFQFIFSAGFSTADKVSDLSGRGVGLDVVRSNLEKINGKIHISSKLEQGTTFRLTIPLTTAITDGIVVALSGERYILPIHSIREIVQVTPKDYVEISKAGKVVKVRDALVPVINIANILGFVSQGKQTSSRRDESMLVVIESLNEQMAMPVDEILGQAQVVVKPVATGQNIPEVAGAAILGDGRTVLILDPAMIVAQAVHTTKEVLPPKVAAA